MLSLVLVGKASICFPLQLNVARLPEPYGNCTDTTERNIQRSVFEEVYPVGYSTSVSHVDGKCRICYMSKHFNILYMLFSRLQVHSVVSYFCMYRVFRKFAYCVDITVKVSWADYHLAVDIKPTVHLLYE